MDRTKKFTGTYTAIVTPFKGGKVDETALTRLIKAQIKGGVDGVVPVGTTGESPTLDYEEHVRVIQATVDAAEGRILVLAGTGANSTSEAIYLTKAAEDAGADGTLQVAPYYNKPTQQGLFEHFAAIAQASALPMVLYSIPGRCGIEIAVETTRRLADACPNVAGMKEAGGNPDRVSQLRAKMGPGFSILSGDDSLTLPFMAVGADGVVSVASNVIPSQVSRMVREYSVGNMAVARKLHARYFSLFKDLFLETNPIPVKAALAMMGRIDEEYRLPMCRMGDKARETLMATMKECGLL